MATGGFIFLMMVLPKGKSEYGFWHGFFQHHQQQATPAETFNQSENHPIENNLVGKRGVATTVLMPGGKADIEGQSWSVCSESGAIEKGTAIEVISQEGQQLLVKTFTESTQGLDI
jgi:membrane-bound ClpP family serine protease